MSVTWKELQETCLRKMDSLDGISLVRDSNTTAYLNAMPAAANEALTLLATNGRYWRKLLTLERNGEEDGGQILGGLTAYDLQELAGDFYCIEQVKLAKGGAYGSYDRYSMEGDTVFLVPTEDMGTFRIWYNAYPAKITAETPDEEIIDLHPEAVNYVAHYMAGQLYKHDDISIAQIYMNEFFEWLSLLQESAAKARGRNSASGGWTSVKGWY